MEDINSRVDFYVYPLLNSKKESLGSMYSVLEPKIVLQFIDEHRKVDPDLNKQRLMKALNTKFTNGKNNIRVAFKSRESMINYFLSKSNNPFLN